MFQDTLDSIKLTLHERVANPILGPLFLSMAVLNYHFFVILLSSETLEEKFYLLDSHFDYSKWETWARIFGWPALIAFLYIYLLPIPSKYVYSYIRKRQQEILKIRQETEDENPLTQAEARELRTKHLELESYYQKVIKEKNQEILDLRQAPPKEYRPISLTPHDEEKKSQSSEVKIWEQDFETFKSKRLAASFEKNLDYIFSGRVLFNNIEDSGSLAAWGLIEGNEKGTSSMTEKGKYFARKIKMGK